MIFFLNYWLAGLWIGLLYGAVWFLAMIIEALRKRSGSG